MKYRAENNLNIFEFHDAKFSLLSFKDKELALSAEALNIHKDTDQNPYEYDMKIESAKLTFSKFKVLSFEPIRAYKVDDEGNWYTDEPRVILKGEEAEKRFLEESGKSFFVNYIEIRKQKIRTRIEIGTTSPNPFIATISFKDVLVEWDKYLKKAWYEYHKQYFYQGYLATPEGDVETNLHVVFHEEDVYYKGELQKAPVVSVGLKYNGKGLWGQGKEYTWEDAFADLQKQLPDSVLLKCCMTCCYGNMCPYGNKPGEIYCTKDFSVNSKEDMCNLFDNNETSDIYSRAKGVADCCDDYAPQSEEYYTYNSYLYYLNK